MRSFLIFLLSISYLTVLAQPFTDIGDYHTSRLLATRSGEELIAIRSFTAGTEKYLLLVDPQTLKTRTDLASRYTLSAGKLPDKTPYAEALGAAALSDVRLQNAGIDRAVPGENGIDLTIDLCPSHKTLDRVIFTALFKEFGKVERPAPVAISVSGKWLLRHPADLEWLQGLVRKKQLAITWINHSYNHEVTSLPLRENFLLSPGTDLDIEVLDNEKLMLSNGLTPSVFFRFPGLVSDQTLLEKIELYGLIPVGSDAWLAKGQPAHTGSIVLIHGNGNEELGVRDFLRLLKSNQTEVLHHQWSLFDLSDSLEKEY